MVKPVLKSVPEIASLAALLATPLVNCILPKAWIDAHVAIGLDVKDSINIALILALSLLVLALALPGRMRPFLHLTPFYERVEHSFFYEADGTVTVRSLMILNAGWRQGLQDLPSEGFLWFNEIERDQLHYRLLHFGQRQDRTLTADYPSIAPVAYTSPRTGENGARMLSWRPRISSPMRRFERIAYQVEVVTPGTETAAFSEDGTTFGFGVSIATYDLLLRAYAPAGFIVDFLPPTFTLRNVDTTEEIRVLSPGGIYPRRSIDLSVAEVAAPHPKTRRRYWVHYRFLPAGQFKERSA